MPQLVTMAAQKIKLVCLIRAVIALRQTLGPGECRFVGMRLHLFIPRAIAISASRRGSDRSLSKVAR
jgi:hypothetical protein